jgi:hypothetical protein
MRIALHNFPVKVAPLIELVKKEHVIIEQPDGTSMIGVKVV